MTSQHIFTYLSNPPSSSDEFHALLITNKDLDKKKLAKWWSGSKCNSTAYMVVTQTGDDPAVNWLQPEEQACNFVLPTNGQGLTPLLPETALKYVQSLVNKYSNQYKNAILFKIKSDGSVRYSDKLKLSGPLPLVQTTYFWAFVAIAFIAIVALALLFS